MPYLLSLRSRAIIIVAALVISTATDAYDLPPFSGQNSERLFTLHGSNTIGASLAPNLVRDYLEAKGLKNVTINPQTEENEYRVAGQWQNQSLYVDIAAHGSSTGFQSLDNRQADIAMASRPIKDAEVKQLDDLGNMRDFSAEHVIAIDGLAVITHPDNPVDKLTIDQIGQVFSGTISNWKELGGRNAAINLYARDEKSGTWDTFQSLVLGKKYRLSAKAKRFESNDILSDRVARDTRGIGFVGLASVRAAKPVAVADVDQPGSGARAMLPYPLSVATEDYPLSRRLFLYTPPDIGKPAIKEFIHFVQSEPGQKRVQHVGFVAQTPVGLKPDTPRAGPEEYVKLTQNAERLSVNFRFKPSSASLDNKARQDILRVVNLMQKPEYADKRLLLIGFGDEKQNQERAEILSKLRAIAVKSALHDYRIATEPVMGFGAFLPVAANRGDGRIKNQRVEVWLL